MARLREIGQCPTCSKPRVTLRVPAGRPDLRATYRHLNPVTDQWCEGDVVDPATIMTTWRR